VKLVGDRSRSRGGPKKAKNAMRKDGIKEEITGTLSMSPQSMQNE
jgi:hypothetical protein